MSNRVRPQQTDADKVVSRLCKTDETAMTRPFSVALKQQMIGRLTGVNALSAAQLARETGITQQNLSRWLSEARNAPFGTRDDGMAFVWSAEQKARIITQAAGLSGNELIAYLQAESVKPCSFRRWRAALEEAGEESVGTHKRIRMLERELVRKEKALAEAATLLVLRDSMESQLQEEDDRVNEHAEEEQELGYLVSTGAASMDNSTPSSSIAEYRRRNGARFSKNSES